MTAEQILQWAASHGYPAIVFFGKPVRLHPVQGLPDVVQPMKYAIGVVGGGQENKALWRSAIALGKEDMVDGLIAYIKDAEESR
jgi:hypothetical protein